MGEFEAFKALLLEKWPDFAALLATIIAYFLLYLFKGRVNGTSNSLTSLFREKMQEIATRDADIRTDLDAKNECMEKNLADARKEYQTAKLEFQQLTETLTRTKNALMAFVMEDNNDRTETDATDTTDTTEEINTNDKSES